MSATGIYNTTGPLARSGDYTRILLGDETGGGSVQIIDGNTESSTMLDPRKAEI